MEPTHIHEATCTRVVDADTYVLEVSLDFRVSVSIEARIHGIDTWETSGKIHPLDPDRAKGRAATAFVQSVIAGARPLMIQSYKDERSFARWVCDIELPSGENLADLLRAAGFEKTPLP